MVVQSVVDGMKQKNNNSVWITANAGSGKTTFLTRRVVALLLQRVVPERVCCITYTKAAASEMQARVLELLRELLLASDEICHQKVSELLGRAATEADIAHARGLFGTVLDSASGGLQLTTIHGFCQSILRRFPLEAGIAPHFAVLDDAAADKLLGVCKNRLLKHYNSVDPALNAALELLGSRGSESRFDDYLSAIVTKRGQWETIWRNQTRDLLRDRLFAAHGLDADANKAQLTLDFIGCIGDTEAEIIRAHLVLLQNHTNATEKKVGRVLADWLASDAAARPAILEDFLRLFLLSDKSGLQKNFISRKHFPDDSPLQQVMQTLGARVLRYQQQMAALVCAQETYAVALMAEAMLRLYEQAKAEQYALDYDDLIGKTRQLFVTHLAWVMTKLDHRIDHLLIDEAQDTSGEQWDLAHALVEELIAANEGVGSGTVPRSLLVVGDEKQSIYSFQGAAPELFAAKKTEFAALLEHSYAPLRYESLSNSYRSAEVILTLVDHVTSQPVVSAALSSDGEQTPHLLKRTHAAGLVALYPPLIAPENEAPPALTLPLDYTERNTAAQLLADSIADTVQQWLANGRLLESEGRPLAPGDVLVLVHRRKPIVLPLIRALQLRGVPVEGIDRLTLSEHLAVRDLLALMRWVLNPADDLSLAHVLRSPIIGMSDEALRALCVGRVGALWARINGDMREMLERHVENRDALPYDFLTDVLEVGGARRRFAERFGEEVHEVLDELKAQAAAMPRDMPPTLGYFYEWLAGSRRDIKREVETGKAGRVRIMTVHGAKGLEAPVVILADTVNLPTTQHERMYFTRDAQGQQLPVLAISDEAKDAPLLAHAKKTKAAALVAEYYRLLYVALTRARDELHIWGTASKIGTVKAGSWYEVVQTSMQAMGAVDNGQAWVKRDVRPAVAAPEKNAAVLPDERRGDPLPPWANSPAPAYTNTADSVSPSHLVAETIASPYAQGGGAALRARGVRIHRMLELLGPESDAETLHRLAVRLAPEWTEKEQQMAIDEIAALYAQEPWIWQSPSHAEVNIAGTITMHRVEVGVNGQIDRLIETADAIVILDYKTGRHVPSDAYGISELYRVQLKTYHALVTQLYPAKPVRTAILWTAIPKIMWCDDVVAATPWPNQFVMQETPLVA